MKKQSKNVKHKNEKEHYVPQFYLKYFSLNNDLKNIWVYDKKTSEIYSQSIKNVAQEIGYNTTEKESTENEYSEIELEISPYINNLFKKNNSYRQGYEYNHIEEMIKSFDLVKMKEYKQAINIFFVLQYFRTKKFRERCEIICYNIKYKLITEYILNFFYTPLYNNNRLYFPNEFIFLNINLLKNSILFKNSFYTEKILSISLLPKIDTIKNYIDFYKYFYLSLNNTNTKKLDETERNKQIIRMIKENKHILKFRRMILLKNETKIPFITSDEPVIITDKYDLNKIENVGLLNPLNTLITTFNSMYCIVFYDTFPLLENIYLEIKNNYKNISNELENNNGYLNDRIEIVTIPNNKQGESFINQISIVQYKNSKQYIFACKKDVLNNLKNKVNNLK